MQMESNDEFYEYDNHASWHILTGLLIGGLAGAATMLLLAPQSGKQTRTQIQRETSKLRHRVTNNMKDAVAQARVSSHGVSAGVQEKVGQLKHRGQDKLVQQLDRVSDAIDAGKAAVKAA